jgi:hypothetical protein
MLDMLRKAEITSIRIFSLFCVAQQNAIKRDLIFSFEIKTRQSAG